jgi:hypothetical protein
LKISELAALIVAYKRSSNLKLIIQECLSSNIHKIYIAIDGPADKASLENITDCISVAHEFKKLHPHRIFTKFSEVNLGAAVSILSGCSWIFSREDFAVVIEDDCLPTKDFFSWVRQSEKILFKDPRVFIISGNQFAPVNLTGNIPSLSKYPLTWGWATSKYKWDIMASYIVENKMKKRSLEMAYSEFCFWRSGSRRAMEGYIDAWDIPLAFILRQIGGNSLLPATNLVKNIGGDAHATHTLDFSKWLNFPTKVFYQYDGEPEENPDLDDWYRKVFFNISFRHIFSTKISWFLDNLGIRKKVRSDLLERLNFKIG